MNIHEHQAKEILKEFGAPVSKGVVVFSVNEIEEKIKELKSRQFVLKLKYTLAVEVKAVELSL